MAFIQNLQKCPSQSLLGDLPGRLYSPEKKQDDDPESPSGDVHIVTLDGNGTVDPSHETHGNGAPSGKDH